MYATDLSAAEWAILESLLPRRYPYGRHPKWSLREIVNGVNYVLKTGCQWYLLPKDYPPYQTVFGYYRQWRRSGLWEEVNTKLRERVRESMGRETTPSAAIIDSQSVKTTEKGGSGVGTMAKR